MTTQEKLDILEEQERKLVFEVFTNHDALVLGKSIADSLIESERPIAIIIRLGEYTVFSYTMKGKEESHFGWANKKANIVLKTGHSSMYVKTKHNEMGDYGEYDDGNESYAFACGAFPIREKDRGIVGVIGMSGLVDPEDHTVIVQALEKMLGVQVRKVTEE